MFLLAFLINEDSYLLALLNWIHRYISLEAIQAILINPKFYLLMYYFLFRR